MLRSGTDSTSKIISGAIAGGILAAAASYFFLNPGSISITHVTLGALLGGGVGSLSGRVSWGTSEQKKHMFDGGEPVKLLIREEELDILKEQIKTGEVSVHTETINEVKTITVPISKEQLVIEKNMIPGATDEPSETIRIPLSEEKLEINKHKVLLNEVYIQKHRFQELKHISEVLKKEQVHVEIVGEPAVVEQDSSKKQ